MAITIPERPIKIYNKVTIGEIINTEPENKFMDERAKLYERIESNGR